MTFASGSRTFVCKTAEPPLEVGHHIGDRLLCFGGTAPDFTAAPSAG